VRSALTNQCPVESGLLQVIARSRTGTRQAAGLASITVDELRRRNADVFRDDVTPGVPCPGRAALSAIIRRGFVRVEPADPTAAGDLAHYTAPTGRDRLLLTTEGADHLTRLVDMTDEMISGGNEIEHLTLHGASKGLRESASWISDQLMAAAAVGPVRGVQYDTAATLIGEAVAALARAAVANGSFLTRDAFLDAITEAANTAIGD
jgi:hypothetical protein